MLVKQSVVREDGGRKGYDLEVVAIISPCFNPRPYHVQKESLPSPPHHHKLKLDA